jgi:fatty-acid peroxygenase
MQTPDARAPFPRVAGEQSLRLLLEGYPYGLRRFERFRSDTFATRLAGQRVLFLRGAEAARFFYEGGRFDRTASLPPTVLRSLQDVGSVQTLAGPQHRARKALFLDVLDESERARMVDTFRDQWRQALPAWCAAGRIVLHVEVADVLTRTVCEWAGIPLTDREARSRTGEFLAMIDGAGSFGPRNWWGLLRRSRTERWARDVLKGVAPDSETVVGRLRQHRDADGSTLDLETAGVELLNLLRPTVAVGRFIVFAALALHRHPKWERAFREGDYSDLREFVQEVRRCAPFFPLVGGRATQDLQWHGSSVPLRSWVMLDIFATNRDDRLWADPMRFIPERHRDTSLHTNALIAQGAGDYADGHRCPGEPATIDLLQEAVRLMTSEMAYRVPLQDLGIDVRRFPTLPASGFELTDISAIQR